MHRAIRFIIGTVLFWGIWLAKCSAVLWFMYYIRAIDSGIPPKFILLQWIFIFTSVVQVQKLKKLIFRQTPKSIKETQFRSIISMVSNCVLLVVDFASFLFVLTVILGQGPANEAPKATETFRNSTIENLNHNSSPIDITAFDKDLIKLCELGFEKGYDEDQVFAMAINAGYGRHSVEEVLEWYRVRRNHPPYLW